MSLLGGPRQKEKPLQSFPLVQVKDVVVFPNTVVPFVAVSRGTVAAVEEAAKAGGFVFITLLKPGSPEREGMDVYADGTLCQIAQRLAMPDGSIKLALAGKRRGHIERLHFDKPYVYCDVSLAEAEHASDPETDALARVVQKSMVQYAEASRRFPAELLSQIERAEDPAILCDLASSALAVKAEKKQALLECPDLDGRLRLLVDTIEGEIEILSLQKRITQKVKAKIERGQREYYLQEQLKEINRELGREGEENEGAELEARLLKRDPPAEVLEKARRELSRLSKLQPFSPEAGVLRAYCEWLADLPWSERSEENRDIDLARSILDQDHYGLHKPKRRILEFIAVRQLSQTAKGPILCLVGAPGTGKTSLARSVARALGREFVRMSLGGLRDEAEIRGHRKTYVGALPGKILQGMKNAKTVNPVFLLDEIDKMSSDFRGDPASALLEVLDPEQNRAFQDLYLELPYDLSRVMFITTANSLHSIPFPLLDRMEVIEVPGYSEYEKLAIAKEYLIPRQLEECGLSGAKVELKGPAILELIRSYTMESGVRSLEREIARVARRLATEAVAAGFGKEGADLGAFSYTVSASKLPSLLGPPQRPPQESYASMPSGCALGLAWTEAGGAPIPVETVLFEGDGSLILTGNLGDVMKESARTALSFLRSRIGQIPRLARDFGTTSIHVHVPEGAIPKDGPSAGLTILSAMVSLLAGMPVAQGFAMTGEITLSGRILPVGGIKEKILAAHRAGATDILLPAQNRKDLEDIPAEVLKAVRLHFAEGIMQALQLLFPDSLFKKPRSGYATPATKKKKRA
jgi:ATP-dependent Lon protease